MRSCGTLAMAPARLAALAAETVLYGTRRQCTRSTRHVKHSRFTSAALCPIVLCQAALEVESPPQRLPAFLPAYFSYCASYRQQKRSLLPNPAALFTLAGDSPALPEMVSNRPAASLDGSAADDIRATIVRLAGLRSTASSESTTV